MTDFWTVIQTALAFGLAILIVAVFAAIAYMIIEAARQTTKSNKGRK